MVSYTEVRDSNSRILTSLPAGLVAVFVGGTNGIGEYTLKQVARHTKFPRVYFVGRSQEAGDRIRAECEQLNPDGSFTFIRGDASLIKNVDELCRDIKAREKYINLLFLSIGTLDFYSKTSEGLPLAGALIHYSRTRFIHNFLPELQAATSLKRVVSVFAATKEGPFSGVDDIPGEKLSLLSRRGHAASLVTLGMEAYAKMAPDVSFIHDFPGPVKSGIGREMQGIVGIVVRLLATVLGPFFNIPNEESGAFHLFFATSACYPPQESSDQSLGVSLAGGTQVARGIDGMSASGMYCIDEKGQSAVASTEKLLAGLRDDGQVEKVLQHTKSEWERILEKA